MKRDNWRGVFTFAGIFIFIIYLAFTNPFKILLEVDRFEPIVFVVAVGVNYIGLVFLAASWHILLRSLGFRNGLWKSIQISFVGLFVVWMLPFPSGFEIVRAYLIRDDDGGNWGKAVSSVVVNKVYYFISFGILISIGAFTIKFINRLRARNRISLEYWSNYNIYGCLFSEPAHRLLGHNINLCSY